MANELTEEISKLQNEFFNIHSLGNLLGSYYYEAIEAGKIESDPKEVSNPLLSISNMIMEKAEKCLEILSQLEELDSKGQGTIAGRPKDIVE